MGMVKMNKEKEIVKDSGQVKLSTIMNMIIVFLSVCLLSFIGYRGFSQTEVISYEATSKIHYSVCYHQENALHNERCLPQEINNYVTRYIDYILVDFNYDIKLNKDVNITYNYQIIGELLIHDRNDPNLVKHRIPYVFMPKKDLTLNTTDELRITEQIKIIYEEYNAFVNEYRQDAGIQAAANLRAKMHIELNVKYEDEEIPVRSEIALNIPVGEPTIRLTGDYNPLSIEEGIEISTNQGLINQILLVILLVSAASAIGLGIIVLILLYKRHQNTPIYIKFLNEIRRKYDVDITNLKSLIDTDKEDTYTYLDVTSFRELYEEIKKSNNKQIYWNEKEWKDKKGKITNRITWFFIFIDDKKVVRFIVDENEITESYKKDPKVISKYRG